MTVHEEGTQFFAGAEMSMANVAVFDAIQIILGQVPGAIDKMDQCQGLLFSWFRAMDTRDNIHDYLSSSFRPMDLYGPSASFGNAENPSKAAENPFVTH